MAQLEEASDLRSEGSGFDSQRDDWIIGHKLILYNDFTLSAWYKSTDTSVSDDEYIYVHDFNFEDELVFGPTDDQLDKLRLGINRNHSWDPHYGTSDIVDQQWHHLVAVRGGRRIKLYVDGVEETDEPDAHAGLTVSINGDGPFIGDYPGNTEQVHGTLDEVRLSDTARSADWIKTQFINQAFPGNILDVVRSVFYTVGNEEVNPVSAVKLTSFSAIQHKGGALLRWKSALDVNNLGWHVYRKVNGKRVQLTPDLIAGSALMYGPGIQLNAGNSYMWWDAAGSKKDRYWLGDKDISGKLTMHGPVKPIVTGKPPPKKRPFNSLESGRSKADRTDENT